MTALKPTQLAAVSSPSFQLLAFLPSGAATLVQIDGSLILDTTTSPPTLRANIFREMVDVWKPQIPQTDLPLSHIPINAPLVTYNGMVGTLGEDYTHTAGTKLVTLLRPAENGDNVQVRYLW